MSRLAALLLLALATGASLAAGELVLRMAGFASWTYAERTLDGPKLHEPDVALGWRNKPGSYAVPRFDPVGQESLVTILQDGRRRTASSPTAGTTASILLVGDSFTAGWALSDHETYGWKLQKRYPPVEVRNYGVAAYGSYQSLLMLERTLPEAKRPVLVIYGFLEHHEVRNAATASWLELLARLSRRGHVAVPFATIGLDGELDRHPPFGFPELPLRSRSVLVTAVERTYVNLRARRHEGLGRALTERILLEMSSTVRAANAELLVVLLDGTSEARQHYELFLSRNQIAVLDCFCEEIVERSVPGDAHPNGTLNSAWVDCVAPAVEGWLADASAAEHLQQHGP